MSEDELIFNILLAINYLVGLLKKGRQDEPVQAVVLGAV